MSYKALRTLLETSSEGTDIRKVICSDQYAKISDIDKNQYPLLHCMITGGSESWGDNGAMFNDWKVTAYLYMLPAEGGSVGDLDFDTVNDLNELMESMIAVYSNNIYESMEVNTVGNFEVTTSLPTQWNGANCWQLSMNINMLNQNVLCVDNC